VYVDAAHGNLSWYKDPLPTNCVGDWVCAGGTGAGFPRHAHCRGPEYGYHNLAVFFHACSFNCLFCQNWSYRQRALTSERSSVGALVADVDEKTACICYFGGDPTPQMPFSIRAAKRARMKSNGKILRLCWETNGSMNVRLLDKIMDLAVISGGCVKFDLKAWDDSVHRALTGVTNRQTLANFKRAAQAAGQRSEPPALIASTLLVPGYVDVEEVANLAQFIASVDPDIPYALLAFQPQFYLADLPLGTEAYAEKCFHASKAAGLNNVRIGNRALLLR
jgi:pyruvate formate lyase activating enzyme